MTHTTREGWLQEVTELLRPEFENRAGLTIPKKVAVSCGFPSRRATSRTNRRIGECWPGKPGTPIFVSPVLEKALDVAQVLVHELVHASLPEGVGHKAPFRRAMLPLELGGKPTATVRTRPFDLWVGPIIKTVGAYPHKALDPKWLKVQGTRMLKLQCPSCGAIVRTTNKWIEEWGNSLPVCPCGSEFELQG